MAAEATTVDVAAAEEYADPMKRRSSKIAEGTNEPAPAPQPPSVDESERSPLKWPAAFEAAIRASTRAQALRLADHYVDRWLAESRVAFELERAGVYGRGELMKPIVARIMDEMNLRLQAEVMAANRAFSEVVYPELAKPLQAWMRASLQADREGLPEPPMPATGQPADDVAAEAAEILRAARARADAARKGRPK